MSFYENKLLKLRKSLQKLLEEDLVLVKKYVDSMMQNIKAISSDIYNEYMNMYQRKLMRQVLVVMEDESKSVYEKSTKNLLEQVVRIESEDFLNYRPLFDDMVNLVNFMNDNSGIKKQYLSDIRFKARNTSSVKTSMSDITINI
jgi:hypothetical protein